MSCLKLRGCILVMRLMGIRFLLSVQVLSREKILRNLKSVTGRERITLLLRKRSYSLYEALLSPIMLYIGLFTFPRVVSLNY